MSLGLSSQAVAAVEWNDSSSTSVLEKLIDNVSNCTLLGRVQQPKQMGQGFSYSFKETKKVLAKKVKRLGGDTMVLDQRWMNASHTTPLMAYEADAYKCN